MTTTLPKTAPFTVTEQNPTVYYRDGRSVGIIDLKPGTDYKIVEGDGCLLAVAYTSQDVEADAIGGFHVDLAGKILRSSLWDTKFRPKCADPRGMFFARIDDVPGWYDIYLMNRDGLSRADSEIADGWKYKPTGHDDLNHTTATKILADQGKQLLSRREFEVVAAGSEQGSVCPDKPLRTARVAGLTSSFGMEQSFGGLWIWSRDPEDEGYFHILGGSWHYSGYAGPSYVHCGHASDSDVDIGARGRCDHLELE